jgi:hypothetical protein
MKKAVFLASLAVMTANVFGMIDSSNIEDTHNARIAIQSDPYVKAKKIILDKLNSGIRGTREFSKKLLYVHNLNLDKFISESTADEIVGKLNWLEGSISDEWKKEAKNILTKKCVLGVNEKSTNDLIKSLVGLRDKQKKRDQKIDPEVISAIKHAFECKDLFLCLADIRSNLQNNAAILPMLLLGKNKIGTNKSQLDALISMYKNDHDVKIFFECTGSVEGPLFAACELGNLNVVKYLIRLGVDINEEDNYEATPLFEACQS